MQVIVKYGNSTKEFNDKPQITIGSTEVSDFVVQELGESVLKLVYSSKYNNYVLVNSSGNKDILFNNKSFSKVLVTPKFTIFSGSMKTPIEVVLKVKVPVGTVQEGNSMVSANSVQAGKDVFDCDIEKHRITNEAPSGAPTLISARWSGWARSERIETQDISASARKGQGTQICSVKSGRQRSIPSRTVSSIPLGQVARFRMFPSWVVSAAEHPSSAHSICSAVPSVCWWCGAEEIRARMSDTREPGTRRSL